VVFPTPPLPAIATSLLMMNSQKNYYYHENQALHIPPF